jgi:hypothetical protein
MTTRVAGAIVPLMLALLTRLRALTKPAPKAEPGQPAARLYIITDRSGKVVACK